MFALYCKKCNHLIERIEEELHHGETIVKTCERCQAQNSYHIQYKAISRIIHKPIAG